jgi:iron complex outermembrane receptor protein
VKNISYFGRALLGGCSAFSLILSSSVFASDQLEEIIVTAQKRDENIQNVPIAITAINGTSLERAGIGSTQQLPLAVPALSFAQDAGFAVTYLRGIGTNITGPGVENSVATFIDGVYVSSQSGTIFDLLGTQRIEVLEGPQGTLYGRNATGGAINIYTLTPEQQFDAGLTTSYGNYNTTRESGHISGGVTDTLAVGLYFGVSNQDIYYKYVPAPPVDQPLHDTAWGVRGKAVWTPTDSFKLTASIERTHELNGDLAAIGVQPNALSYALGAPKIIDPKDWVASNAIAGYSLTATTTGILREEGDLGFANLVGITGYRKLESAGQEELDGTDLPGELQVTSVIPDRQISQELQLISPTGSYIKWQAGLYFFYDRTGYEPLIVASKLLIVPGTSVAQTTVADETTTSYAGYAQADIPLEFLVQNLSLTLGGRVTKDTKTLLASSSDLATASGVCLACGAFPAESKSWTRFTPKATLTYKWDSSMVYATYAQGFKSGLFNASAPGAPGTPGTAPVAPEVLTDYEVGAKSDLFNEHLRLNVASYFYQYKDVQVQSLTPNGGISAIVQNAAAAQAFGVEFSSSFVVTDQLRLNSSAAWENSKYTNFPGAPFFSLGTGPGGANVELSTVSGSGHPLVNAPDFVITLGPDYKIPLSSGASVEANATLYHNSGYQLSATGQLPQSAYSLVNAFVAYTFPDKHWTATFWGNNLTDKQYYAYGAVDVYGTYVHNNRPRMYGGTVSYAF